MTENPSNDKIIYAFDPGLATGMAIGSFSDTRPLTLEDAAIFSYDQMLDLPTIMESTESPDVVVSELFVLSSGNEFTAELTAKKVEGILEFTFRDAVQYRTRDLKRQVSDDLLRELGWWKTGTDVDWEDGRDANDAIIHMLGYVAFDLEHLPTLREYFR